LASFSSGISAFLVLHAYFNGKLQDVSKNMFHYGELEPKETFAFRVLLAAFANSTYLLDSIPFDFLLNDRSNFDNWMPLYRQLITLVKLKINTGRIRDKAEKILKRFPG
jgi:hypothetical protein